METFINYVLSNENVQTVLIIVALFVATLGLLLSRWVYILYLLTNRDNWTYARIEHLWIGLMYVAFTSSFLYWVLIHPLSSHYGQIIFNSIEYYEHTYTHLMPENLIWTFVFGIITNLFLFHHIAFKKVKE